MTGHGVGVLLLSAVAGYWVLERAVKQKGTLQKVGGFIGGFIIVVSLLGAMCKVACTVACATGAGGWCGTAGKQGFYGRSHGPMCPFAPKASSGEMPAGHPAIESEPRTE